MVPILIPILPTKKSFPKAAYTLFLGSHVYDQMQTPNAGQSSTKTTKPNNQSLLFPLTPSSQYLDRSVVLRVTTQAEMSTQWSPQPKGRCCALSDQSPTPPLLQKVDPGEVRPCHWLSRGLLSKGRPLRAVQ